jgi:hypothetical protein
MITLNDTTVKALPAPERGNKIYYFAGAVLQGVPAPKGFGVRVTKAGSEPSCSTTSSAGESSDIRSASTVHHNPGWQTHHNPLSMRWRSASARIALSSSVNSGALQEL